ncbi:MAG: alpha/beta hydrolase [Acholeplasmataceae bacterium]|nr:alpha/beta hydrolase [Acholeplasmataceae bacterium]
MINQIQIGKNNLEAMIHIPEMNSDNGIVCIIVGGSDRIDADGNIGKIKLNTYKYLAEFLTGLGIYTIRYNKRGIGKSQGDFLEAGVTELLEDIDAVYQYLVNNSEISFNKIILIGHSEGSILSTIYADLNRKIDGLVLLSGAYLDLQTAQIRQYIFAQNELNNIKGFLGKVVRFIYKSDSIVEKQKEIYSKVINSTQNTIRINGKIIQAKWLREHLSYDINRIKRILSTLDIPVFASFGTKDIQSRTEDMKKLKELEMSNYTIIKIDNMDHMLRDFKFSPTIINQRKQYKYDSTLPLSTNLLKELQEFLSLYNS